MDRESKTDYAEDIDDAVAKMTNEEGIQSITLGFGTYKPFGPVLMRTLLARIHIHWPESKLTKSDIN